ncbi:PAS domain S-box-containing protein/diguanylate cyclase (GGDEF) domain-containing protein [Gracilibacillus ureilyticus]|uniref:PAS domain S-box-containing protein/diguanylate cyclase (GGDEF) domain-containing protein n=1 Tax=Gracilibacillus ureilyticus TaxID=531814 RepID=A0A1H9U985_9BACI|nr:sensor domain-containing diguanylate cyclase [Gracilibacillus ureilyticus]SES05798.1 PAS domain S-box-containing protein/diguanylate cyclase (GGDEF) domain-containing protein [Gracilibacillus ureilyticus]
MMELLFFYILYLVPASTFIFMAGMVYSYNRHSARHVTCSLLYAFTSMWFFGVFTSVVTYPDLFNEIMIYWVNGAVAITALLSLHLWLLTARMYERKNGKFLKLLFVPGVVLVLTMPIDSWMWNGETFSQDHLFVPGLGLHLLWLVEFVYLLLIFIITVKEMRQGSMSAKLWFKGLILYFIWTSVMLAAALLFQETRIFFYLIPHGSLFWGGAVFLSIYRFDYLSSYEKRYQVLFNRSPLGIMILDEEAIVVEASPRVSQYLGVKREELIQSSIVPFLGGVDKQEFLNVHQKLFKERLSLENAELSFVNKQGERKTIVMDSEFILVEEKPLEFLMVKDITEAKRKEERVQYLAYHDILTGLSNRAAFEKKMAELLNREEAFHFLLLDLNKLKLINDTFGHQVGDHAIRHIATILQESTTEEKQHVARLGGDEFVLLLDVEGTDEVIEQIHRRLESPMKMINHEPIYLSASIGVSRYPEDGETFEQLYRIADKRMYIEKGKGQK